MSTTRHLAVSYSRISDPKQAVGDGEDRQARDFRAFCLRHDLTPLREVYADKGRSGFKGDHRRKGRLGQLIEAAKAGRFEPGTVIVVEAWDRLGRLRPDKQLNLLQELLGCGVRVGVCRLDDIFSEDDFGTHKWTTLAVFVQLAYQESKQKAERVAASWQRRRERSRESGGLITGRLPAWLEPDGQGGARLLAGRAEVVRRVFALAAAGYGQRKIAGLLTREEVPTFGEVVVRAGRRRSQFSGKWLASYVVKLLNDRRAMGEFQPRTAGREPAGPAIPNYYPAAVTEAEFLLARAGRERRRNDRAPRQRKFVNLFKGLLVHARDGESFFPHNLKTAADPQFVYIARTGHGGRGRCWSFPLPVFEEAVLGALLELRPRDVLPRETTSPADGLRAELAAVRGNIALVQEELKDGFDKNLAAVLRGLTAREEALGNRLHEELARSARPAERDWHALPSLVEIAAGGEDGRLRLAAALRGIIDEARSLIVKRGSMILNALQVFFVGGACRSYLLAYRPGCNGRKREWSARSFATVGVGEADLDLRKPAHAKRLERALTSLDLAALAP
jgi:DNA invertase Pin-like site-specific DNA recombinase